MKVIALSGKMRSGKTTLARMLAQSLPHHIVRVSFADEVRREVARGMGYGEDWHTLFHVSKKDIRPVLQAWGHNMRKIRGEDVWIKALFSRMIKMQLQRPNIIFVIDDIRYENEIEAINNFSHELVYNYKSGIYRLICSKSVQISRGCNPEHLSHDSEQQLNDADMFNTVFDSNDNDFHDLFFELLTQLVRDKLITDEQKHSAWAKHLSRLG